VLACPRCTMRFTLGASAAVPPSAPYAGYPPTSQPPAQRPAASDFTEMTPEKARADGEEGPHLPVRGSRLQTILLVGVAAVSLAAAGIAVWYKVTHKPEASTKDSATLFPEKNFSLEEPASPWVQDGTMQGMLGSPYLRVYKRDNPEAFIAVGARDYETQEPRPGDLLQSLKAPLAKILVPKTLEQQPIPEGTTWFALPVKGFNFRGQLKSGAVVEGEAYAVSHKGLGYWFLAWTGENQIFAEQREMFAKVRAKCKFLDLRGNWTARQANVVEFKNNVLGYSIRDGEGIWTEETDEKRVKDEDPKADKYFTARIKPKTSDFAHEAELVIFILDSKGEPLEQARTYVVERENRDVESRGKTSFQAHSEDTTFDSPNLVDGNAPFVLLKSKNDRSEMMHLWAISAIKIGNKTVVACAKCSFSPDDREQFERRFVVLVKSLRGSP
jgi:hypothetical protein